MSKSVTRRYVNVQGDLMFTGACHAGVRRGGGRRGNVTRFSLGSRSRMGRYLRCCVADYRAMLTLTWPSSDAPTRSAAQRAFRAFVESLRRYWKRNGIADGSLFWFREFTESGTCHYHGFVNRWVGKNWLSHAWWRACGKISMSHLRAGTQIRSWRGGKKSIGRYAAKYARKQEQKNCPDFFKTETASGSAAENSAGRFWGVVGLKTQIQDTAGADFGKFFGFSFWRLENAWETLMTGLTNQSWSRKLEGQNGFCDVWVIKRGPEFGAWWLSVKNLQAEIQEAHDEAMAIKLHYANG